MATVRGTVVIVDTFIVQVHRGRWNILFERFVRLFVQAEASDQMLVEWSHFGFDPISEARSEDMVKSNTHH